MATVIRVPSMSDGIVTIGVPEIREAAEPATKVENPLLVEQPVPVSPGGVLPTEYAPNMQDSVQEELLADRHKEALRAEIEAELRASFAVEASQLFDAAREQGYEEGLEAARTECEEAISNELAALQKLLVSTKEAFADGIQGTEDVIVEISFAAISKILGNAFTDKAGTVAVVKEVIGHAKNQEILAIHVSPEDYDLLQSHKDFIKGLDANLELRSDERIVLGGCLIETSGGNLDGRLEIQLQQLRDTLLSSRKMLPE